MDRFQLARVIAAKPDPGWQYVQGTVVSVQAYSITVTLAGGTTNVSGVKYLSPVPPTPGAGVWLISDGKALLAVGMTAAAGRSISPRAYRTTAQTLTTGTETTITWEADESDAYGFWSSGAATVMTCQVPGRYLAVADVRFAANATGIRTAYIERNSSTTIGRVRVAAAGAGATHLTVTSQATTLAISDTIRVRAEQTSGGNLDVVASDGAPSLSLIYLGP